MKSSSSLRRPPFSLALGEAGRYEAKLEWLHGHYSEPWRARRLTHGGLGLAELVADKGRVSRLVAQAVAQASYRLSPVQMVSVFVKDRFRELVRMPALDFVLHGVMADALAEQMEPRLSGRLFSYRRHHSSWHAIRQLASWVRRHRRAEADPRRRGVLVLRADVRKYAESVPVGAHSPLWAELREVTGLDEDHPDFRLLVEVVRPLITGEEGAELQRCVGLALGSPTATMLLNLYLMPLDRALDSVDGAFYARYGDDILFAHPSEEVVRGAISTMDGILAERGLTLNQQKRRLLYFNGAGRAHSTFTEARGARAVPFLGAEVGFDGTVSLPAPKVGELVRDLRQRLAHSRRVLQGHRLDERAPVLCETVNQALDPGSPLAHRYAATLRTLITDRRQLAAIDHQLARLVAWALTGEAGPRAFRAVGYARLRELGLQSLVALRNAD